MQQILAAVTYAAVLGNVFFAAFLAATPADHALPWWVAAGVAGGNALVHALPSDGLPMPTKAVAKVALIFVPLFILLSACGLTPAQVQSDVSTGIQAACTDVMAAQKLNPASPVAVYAVAACGTAGAVGALVQNSATIQWLGQIQQQLATPVAAPVTKGA